MSLKPHVDNVCLKATNSLLRINRVKHLLNITKRQIAVDSLVLSLLNYCTATWSHYSKSILVKAERCQNFTIKVISDGHYKKTKQYNPTQKRTKHAHIWQAVWTIVCMPYLQNNKQHLSTNIYLLPRDRNSRQKNNLFVPH